MDAYYSEKLKQELFSLDDEKNLFSTGKVLDGAFTIASKLYGLTLQKFLISTNTTKK
jgi:peptidyl-dipeptidase Dcp